MSFTGQKDIDYKIMMDLDDRSLLNFCQTDQYVSTLCKNDDFWRRRFQKKFGNVSKPSNQNWRNFYLHRISKEVVTVSQGGITFDISIDKDGEIAKYYNASPEAISAFFREPMTLRNLEYELMKVFRKQMKALERRGNIRELQESPPMMRLPTLPSLPVINRSPQVSPQATRWLPSQTVNRSPQMERLPPLPSLPVLANVSPQGSPQMMRLPPTATGSPDFSKLPTLPQLPRK